MVVSIPMSIVVTTIRLIVSSKFGEKFGEILLATSECNRIRVNLSLSCNKVRVVSLEL